MNLTSPSFSAHRFPEDTGAPGADRESKLVASQPMAGGVGTQAPCPLSCPELSSDLTNILWIRYYLLLSKGKVLAESW